MLLTSNHIEASKIRLISSVFPELAVIAQVAQQPNLIVTNILKADKFLKYDWLRPAVFEQIWNAYM